MLTDLLDYLAEATTPWHATSELAERLSKVGYTEISESDDWQLAAGDYFVRRGGSSIIAFRVPDHDVTGFRIIGAHTDSPNLRLKPGGQYSREGYEMLGIETYGGILLSTWLDRDLGIAGRLFSRSKNGPVEKLVSINRPLCRVANVAIHLNREVNRKGLILNKQTEMVPILGLADSKIELKKMLAEAAEVDVKDIISYELCLFDVTAPALGGSNHEFIFSGRLDNLAMCHAGQWALLESGERLAEHVPVLACFDHEEVGSRSSVGAASSFLGNTLERIALSLKKDRAAYLKSLANSVFFSADMAHAVHPNYAGKHDENFKPHLNGGPVIKLNQNQAYATNAEMAALFREACESQKIPYQQFINRADLACGSTIGPITATRLGIQSIDVGNAMLSMHSIREMSGSKDHQMIAKVFSSLLK